MACYWPIPAAQNPGGGPVKLWPARGSENLALPCGKCIGCRTDKATEWAVRCKHEASQFQSSTFVTLTYDDEHLPKEAHLQPLDLQRVIKRIRKYADSRSSVIDRDRSRNIRFFACGEYGEKKQRPHYHAILFNCHFTDQQQIGVRYGQRVYKSEALEKLWPFGLNEIGPATPGSASYIAQYTLKKVGAGDHDADGVWRPAPFLRMSLRPAIGKEWVAKYATDLTHGYLTEDGRKHGIPRYYQKQLEPMFLEAIKHNSAKYRFNRESDHNKPERLEAAEKIHKRRKELNEQRTL